MNAILKWPKYVYSIVTFYSLYLTIRTELRNFIQRCSISLPKFVISCFPNSALKTVIFFVSTAISYLSLFEYKAYALQSLFESFNGHFSGRSFVKMAQGFGIVYQLSS